MVSKKDAEIEQSTDVELIQADTDIDRWHADNVDSLLFNPREAGSPGRLYSDDDLREIETFDDLVASLNAAGLELIDTDDYLGSGSTVLVKQERMRLVGVPFVVMQWNFTESKDHAGAWFVYVEVMTVKDGVRYAFTDGSKFGIRDQLATITMRTKRFNGAQAKRGLAHRDYEYIDPYTGDTNKVNVYSIA